MSNITIDAAPLEVANLKLIDGTAISFLFDYYQHRGGNPLENIQLLVNALGKVFHSAAALYNRLDDDGLLKTWAIDNVPPGFQYVDRPEGHICYVKTIKQRNPDNMRAVEYSNLDPTPFVDTDLNVKAYGLKAYLAFPVALHGEIVGSLAVVFGQTRSFSALDKQIIEIFAREVTLEEERHFALRVVHSQGEEIQNLRQEVLDLSERLKSQSWT